MLRSLAACTTLASLLAACATPPPAKPPAPEKAPQVTLKESTVVYDGPLRPNSLERIQAVVKQNKVSKLIIRSGGGEVMGSMKVARWIRDNDIDVEVDGMCFSSCANYIFPAGRNKYIVGEGIVGWHGTIEHLVYKHEQGIDIVDAQTLPFILETVAREREFYAATGINSFVGWFGKMAPYEAHNFYYLSQDDMEYFGMHNLHVRSDYLEADLGKYLKKDPHLIRLLKVNRAVTNPSDPRWRGRASAP